MLPPVRTKIKFGPPATLVLRPRVGSRPQYALGKARSTQKKRMPSWGAARRMNAERVTPQIGTAAAARLRPNKLRGPEALRPRGKPLYRIGAGR